MDNNYRSMRITIIASAMIPEHHNVNIAKLKMDQELFLSQYINNEC